MLICQGKVKNYAFIKFRKQRRYRSIRRNIIIKTGQIDIQSPRDISYIISVNTSQIDASSDDMLAGARARAHISVGCNYSTPLVEMSAWIIRRISSGLVNSRNGTETIDNHDVKARAGAGGATRTTSGASARTRAVPRLCTCCTICLTISQAREHGLIITTCSHSPKSLRETRAHGPARNPI